MAKNGLQGPLWAISLHTSLGLVWSLPSFLCHVLIVRASLCEPSCTFQPRQASSPCKSFCMQWSLLMFNSLIMINKPCGMHGIASVGELWVVLGGHVDMSRKGSSRSKTFCGSRGLLGLASALLIGNPMTIGGALRNCALTPPILPWLVCGRDSSSWSRN